MAPCTRVRGFMVVAVAVVVGYLAVVSPAHAQTVCGNGVFEPPTEECDDGNTVSGDACSAACQLELPPNCSVVPASDYETAWGTDAFYLTVRTRGEALGYSSSYLQTARCTLSGSGALVYLAVMNKPGGTDSDVVLIGSRPDVPDPFKTLIYRSVSATEQEIIFADGAIRLTTDPSGDWYNTDVLDVSGQVMPRPGVNTTGVPAPTCAEHDNSYFACLARSVAETLTTTTQAPTCALNIYSCARITGGLKQWWPFFVCFAVAETFSGATSGGWCGGLVMELTSNAWVECDPVDNNECRTEDGNCHKGTCSFVWEENPGGGDPVSYWKCVTANPPEPLCDACHTCAGGGCVVAGCSACRKCDPTTGCTIDVTPPLTAIKWAKVSQWVGVGGNCSCSPSNCTCNAMGGVTVQFYGCRQLPLAAPLKGTCGAQSSGSAHMPPPCDPPEQCKTEFQKKLVWAGYNSCTQCTPGLEVTCQMIAPFEAKGPAPVGYIFDLRTDDEKETGCCTGQPPL